MLAFTLIRHGSTMFILCIVNAKKDLFNGGGLKKKKYNEKKKKRKMEMINQVGSSVFKGLDRDAVFESRVGEQCGLQSRMVALNKLLLSCGCFDWVDTFADLLVVLLYTLC